MEERNKRNCRENDSDLDYGGKAPRGLGKKQRGRTENEGRREICLG